MLSEESDESFDSNIDLVESEDEKAESTKIWGPPELKKDFSSVLRRELQKG